MSDPVPAGSPSGNDGSWRLNYFNYFTEVEEHFQRARGTALFLMSPLDWALIESWKDSGIPLEAVLRGIDAAFDKWRSRKKKSQMVNSLAYCAQEVLKAAEAMAKNLPASPCGTQEPPFTLEIVRAHLENAGRLLRAAGDYSEIAASLELIIKNIDDYFSDTRDLDQRLTVLEEKMAAMARTRLKDEEMLTMRRDLDLQLRSYRGKMGAEQLARLERSFLDRKIYERFNLPRLSLFHIRP